MYCKNCGSQINDNANVCGYCGTPVHTQNGFSNNQQQNNTASGQQVYGAPQPSNMDGGSTGFAIASMILGIVAILMMCCVPSFWLKTIVAVLGLVFVIISLQNKNRSGVWNISAFRFIFIILNC